MGWGLGELRILDYRIRYREVGLEQPTCRMLACWSPSKADAGGRGSVLEFYSGAQAIETGMSSSGACHFFLDLFCAVAICVPCYIFYKELSDKII